MNLADLLPLHTAAILTMNDAAESIRYLETALLKAREAHARAVKTEAALAAAVTAADRAEQGAA